MKKISDTTKGINNSGFFMEFFIFARKSKIIITGVKNNPLVVTSPGTNADCKSKNSVIQFSIKALPWRALPF